MIRLLLSTKSKCFIAGFLFLIVINGNSISKTVPSAIWVQKDLSHKTFGDSLSNKKVLIVSREGEFKEKIAENIKDSLISNGVFVQIDGIKLLKDINPDKYSAIVIINTCMSWQIDNKVQNFFKKKKNYKKVVLLTTSGDPVSCGKGRHVPDYVDAISSASVGENVNEKANEILSQLNVFISE